MRLTRHDPIEIFKRVTAGAVLAAAAATPAQAQAKQSDLLNYPVSSQIVVAQAPAPRNRLNHHLPIEMQMVRDHHLAGVIFANDGHIPKTALNTLSAHFVLLEHGDVLWYDYAIDNKLAAAQQFASIAGGGGQVYDATTGHLRPADQYLKAIVDNDLVANAHLDEQAATDALENAFDHARYDRDAQRAIGKRRR